MAQQMGSGTLSKLPASEGVAADDAAAVTLTGVLCTRVVGAAISG